MKTEEHKRKKIRRRGRRRFVLSVMLLTAVALVAGSLVAVLFYLMSNGTLETMLALLRDVFLAQEINSALIIFWALVIPFLLAALLILNTVRRRKFKYYRRTWEDTVQLAVEAEQRASEKEREKAGRGHRFSALYDIPVRTPPERESGISSLAELCRRFRLYAAAELHLYYTEAQVREFVASLAVSRIIILQGMSGTGKTSLAYAFGEFLGNPSTIIPVQPMWKERSDLLGYYNEFTKKYNETALLRKMYEANGQDKIYLAVLDEMNIARVEYYFAEFLSLLEIPDPELRYLEVVSDSWEEDPDGLKDGRIKLPENMWFLGTANNDDSTFAISDKVYDRAMIVDLDSRAAPFGGEGEQQKVPVTFPEFTRLAESARRGYELTRRNERRLKALDDYLIETFQITFGNRILRQIRAYISVYVSCGGEELEALDDILAKKVLRKLANKDLSLLRGELEEASKFFETLFGDGKMPRCRETLLRAAKL